MRKLCLAVACVLVASLSTGCLVREKVSRNGQVVSDGYKWQTPWGGDD